jgi:predicted AlkP superfamily pyrophosphatase or phosphodiesterase
MAPAATTADRLPPRYDSDDVHPESNSEMDFASDEDPFSVGDTSPGGPREKDRSILQQQDEEEKLLSKSGPFDRLKQTFRSQAEDGIAVKLSKREARRVRRRGSKGTSKNKRGGRSALLMFEMEEGVKDLSSQSSTESFDIDRSKWALDQKQSKKTVHHRFAFIHIAIIALFFLLAFGAYRASRGHITSTTSIPRTLSNGTHTFRPTTILISLDGFRADFLNRGLTPALSAFIASGISPRYMLPSFPSVTFPNHFTLVTGLYPESNGVVGNTFWDPALMKEFHYTDPARSMQPEWWTAEPLWVTAENQGVRTAIHMWPGSEAHIPDVEPTYVDKFNNSEVLTRKVERLLDWLDLPGDDDTSSGETTERRPQLIAAYVPNVDADGHKYGPNSTEIRGTIADVDSMITLLTEGLYKRNLTEIVNIVIVSDHGMATTSTSRMIQLDDIVDLSLIDHLDGWPLRGLRLKNPERDVPLMYEQLLAESEKSSGFDVYTLDTMPERYHFTNNARIAPLWIVPWTGWAVVERKNFDIAEAQTIGKAFHPIGLHGYDYEHPLMRAIFVARGPAFPHAPNSRVPVFQNIDVYNIVCDSLGITPHPNNGTLRLPLKPIGLHSDVGAPELETPQDREGSDTKSGTEIRPGHIEQPSQTSPAHWQNTTKEASPEGEGGDEDNQSGEKEESSWWDFIHNELEKAKEWAKELVESFKNKPDSGAGDG